MRTLSLAIALAAPAACTTHAATSAALEPAAADTRAAPETVTLGELPAIAEEVVRSVVNVSTEQTVQASEMAPFEHPLLPGFPLEPRSRGPQQVFGAGSGVIVQADGVIVTNNHVVEGADRIEVTLANGEDYLAEVIGTDPQSDLAVLRIQDPPADLVPLPWGDSSDLRLGQTVLAVGNALGIGQTVTMGVVSATGRADLGIVDYEDFIQTDAAINPGNSGGALVNVRGELVGIPTAIASRGGGFEGVGFAIPSMMAKEVVTALLETGRVERGFLGVMIQEIDDELQQALELPTSRGVLISDVQPGSPAEEAGFRRGDVVLSYRGQPVEDPSRLRLLVSRTSPGERFEAEVLRDGKRKTVKGTLGSLTEAPGAEAPTEETGLGGVSLTPLTPQARQAFQIPESVEQGALVAEVQPGTPAARAGLRPGDVIVEANEQPVSGPSDVQAAWKRAQERLLLVVTRDGNARYVVMKKPRGEG